MRLTEKNLVCHKNKHMEYVNIHYKHKLTMPRHHTALFRRSFMCNAVKL